MFTGIVEEVGTMLRVERSGQAMVLTLRSSMQGVLGDVKLGDSIAVNGVCLTVIAYDQSSFMVDVMPETYRKTNLSLLRPGMKVNMERAMAATGRFGGHIVQGHVDCTAKLVTRTPEENAVVFRFEPERLDVMRYMLRGGSITVDGISLTLVDVTENTFSVSIIPHTLAETALQSKQAGDTINMECDILGKYIERLLFFKDNNPNSTATKQSRSQGSLTDSFLAEHGFK
ncbi:riboflavin synthase [Paenibacillus sp. N1-5-1-14]|uniref:riboflavin synthase n=1 Tax=Paenibacillus radicibacter TaxID=2972488 RepID=UPI002158C039|nr:riboflavin synthase [Paenibacillus radicibacter]MCR8642349.1 riboflavin synthase [Paenibacillus radicibacter]